VRKTVHGCLFVLLLFYVVGFWVYRTVTQPHRTLMVAACKGDAATVMRLLASGSDPRYRDEKGRSAVQMAAGHGRTQTVLLLLRHNADSTEALIGAIRSRRPALVRAILKARPDALRTWEYPVPPVEEAASYGDSDTVAAVRALVAASAPGRPVRK
jgi:ankyrin repeat protein